MITNRQDAVEYFYKELHHTNYKKDALGIGHKFLPRITHLPTDTPENPVFDLSGQLLT